MQFGSNTLSRKAHFKQRGQRSEYDQARELWTHVMSDEEREDTAYSMAFLLKFAEPLVQKRYVSLIGIALALSCLCIAKIVASVPSLSSPTFAPSLPTTRAWCSKDCPRKPSSLQKSKPFPKTATCGTWTRTSVCQPLRRARQARSWAWVSRRAHRTSSLSIIVSVPTSSNSGSRLGSCDMTANALTM